MVSSDELIQPVDDVESDKVDEVVENDLNSNSVLVSDISLTTDNVSSLQVFLYQTFKLQSLSCKQLCEFLQNSDMLYTNATVADLKNIIKWLKTIYRDKEVVKDLKLSGKNMTLFQNCPQFSVPLNLSYQFAIVWSKVNVVGSVFHTFQTFFAII